MMKMKSSILSVTSKLMITSGLMISSLTFAQNNATQQSSTDTGYGDNPNLIKVLAVKAQKQVQSTAEKVGAATERGVAKIKPSVDNTWQNTKTYTTEKAISARDNTREGIDTAVKKVKETKDNISGQGGVPIQRGSLTQSSASVDVNSAPTQAVNNQSAHNISQATTPTHQTQNAAIPTSVNENTAKKNIEVSESLAMVTQNQTLPKSPQQALNTTAHSPEFSESEIKRQSIPIQTSSADAPVNVESPTSATPSKAPTSSK